MPYFQISTITYPLALNTYNGEYAILDVDGDGDLDIVCARFGPAAQFAGIPIQILLNNGSGGFTDGTSIIFPSGAPLTFHPRGIAIADYNGDGRPDLFIADHGYDELPWPGAQNTLLLSSGEHGFVDATDRLPQLIDFSHSTAAGDIDGDGDSDILVMNTNGGTPNDSTTDPYILVNDGTGHFVRRDDLLPANVADRDSASKYTSCLFFDADGDGDQDLFLGTHGGESATNFSRLLYNDGTGDFSDAVSVDLPTGPWSPLTAGAVAVTTADLNGDGRPDLIVDLENAYQAHYVQLLINHGAAGFVDETPDRMPQSTADDGRWIHSVQAVDLNGDGYVDLIARNGQFPPIFLNDGTGHFVNLPASFLDYGGRGGDTPWFVALNPIDANGDSRMDLIADFINGEMLLFTQQDPGPSQTGTESADALLGDGSSETLSGLGGDDVIFGGAGADVITGGAGADTMVGGAGADRFSDTAANLIGDTIRDLSAGDRIIITNASLAGFTFSVSGQTLTFTGGSLTLGSSLSGMTMAASAAAGGGVQLALVINDVRNDFDGDGRSDILWRHDNGTIADWLGTASGGFSPNNPSVTNSPLNWHIAGTGDFNGDGRDDLLWRSQTGEVGNWLAGANGTHGFNAAAGIVAVPNNWQVQGVGDFNGDGRDDILWRSDAGEIGNWLGTASGGFTANNAQVVVIDAYWQIQGTGDFNGDGYDDVLWRGGNGEVGTWLGNAIGAFAYNSSAGLAAAPGNWQIVGTGDFNGDNRDDIVWRSDIGEVGTWLANPNGSFTANNAQVVMVSTAWHIADVGDFNGDNVDDLLWRHDNGLMTNWLGQTSGFWLENNAAALTHLPVDWTIQAPDSLLV